MMSRAANWESALSAYLTEHENAQFVWGACDCALFAAGAVIAMTGVDVAAAYRGRYSTAIGSARALVRFGQGTLEATFSAVFEPRPIGFARRGDIVMYQGAIGICIGAHALFLRREEDGPGLERIERHLWTHAWSVGD